MPRSSLTRWVLLAALLSVPGCDAVDGGDDYELDLAQVEFYDRGAEVDAPASAAVGETFRVKITTYGGGCILQGTTDVSASDAGAELTPYDRYYVGDNDCTDDLRFYEHTAELRFDAPGEKTIVVHGRRVDADQDVVIEVPLTVRVE